MSYLTAGSVYSQNFDGLPNSGTFTIPNVATPIALDAAPIGATGMGTGDWYFAQTLASGGTARFAVDTGANNTGSVYSYGATGGTDRAIGLLASGSNVSETGVQIVNNTGATITNFTVNFTAETWRRGNNNANTLNVMAFAYSVGATDIATGTFTPFTPLDAVAVNPLNPDSAVNGNAAAGRAQRSATVTGLNWASGQQLVLRWTDTNDANNDDGVGIDDFSFSAGANVQAVTSGGSIASALTAAGPAGIVTVAAGTYPEAIALSGTQQVIFSGAVTINSLSGSAPNSVTLNSGSTLTVGDATNTMFSGVVGGSGALVKQGAGSLAIPTDYQLNTLSGITVSGGTLEVGRLSVRRQNPVIILTNSVLKADNTLNLMTDGTSNFNVISGAGTLQLSSTTGSLTNPDIFFGPNHRSNANYGVGISASVDTGTISRIVLGRSGNNGFGVYLPNTDCMFNGPILGTGGLEIVGQQVNNAGDEVPYEFAAANPFTGPLDITRGSVYLNADNTLTGNNPLTFDPTSGNKARLFLWGHSASVSNLSSSGAGTAGIANGIRLSGTAGTATAPVTLTTTQTGDTTFSGLIADYIVERSNSGTQSTGSLGLTISGTKSLTLTGANTYTGDTTINGKLLVNNTAGSGTGTGNVIVNAGGVLAGSGTITPTIGDMVTLNGTLGGTLTVNAPITASATGVIAPAGAGTTGVLKASSLTLVPGSTYSVDINGTAAGSAYDQLQVAGAVDLGGSTLTVTPGFAASANNQFTIIDGSTPITNTFANAPEGSTVTFSGQSFTITYVGGADGCDVVLTRQPPPVRYVDDDWAGFTNGQAIPDADPVAPGAQPATFGVDAYASINAAIASVPVLGTVIVNAGMYSDAVNVNKQITVKFQENNITIGSLDDSVANAAFNIDGITLTAGGNNNSTQVDSPVIGTGNLVKTGTGTMTLAANNSYTGTTEVSNGVLAAGSSTAFGTTASMTVDAGSKLRVGGFSPTVGALSVAGTVENGAAASGTLIAGGTADVALTGLFQDGVGGGAFSLTLNNSGATTLSNAANSYSGATTVNVGTLIVDTLAVSGVNSDIGASASASGNLVLTGGATLKYTGNTLSFDRALSLGAGGGTIWIDGPTAVVTTSGTIAGGTNPLVKDGPGKLVFSANDALNTGNITVNAGTLGVASLTVSKARVLSIADGTRVESSGTIRTVADGSVHPNAVVTGAGTLTLTSTVNSATNPDIDFNINDAANSTANWGTQIDAKVDLGNLQRFIWGRTNHNGIGNYGLNGDAVFTREISGSGGLTFIAQASYTGTGPMEVPFYLAAANTFTGPVEIQRGSVYIGNANALNGNVLTFNPAAGNNARLFLFGNSISVSNITSPGAGSSLIANSPGQGTIAAATLTVTQGIDATFTGSILQTQIEYVTSFSGISSPLSVVKAGPATLIFTATANDYTGSTTLSGGTLVVPAIAVGGTPSSIGASDASAPNLVLDGGTLRYIGPAATSDRDFTLTQNGGTLDSSGTGALTLTSANPVTYVGSGNRTLNLIGTNIGYNTLTAPISDNGTDVVSVIKSGNGSWYLNGTSSYTGGTTANAGTFGGSATIGNLSISGATLAPGTGPGTLTTGNLSLTSGSTFTVELAGTIAGTTYDQVIANGTISLGNAALNVIPSYSASVGDSFTLISNPGNTPVSGTFQGIAQNGFVFAGGQFFQLSYHGGAGNDVVLTRVTPPVVYVDDDWAGFTNGQQIADADPVTPGAQPATFGVNAFATPNAGIAATTTVGASVIVNAGTYNQAVNIDRAITLVLQENSITFGSLNDTVTAGAVNFNGITLTVGGNGNSTEIDGSITGSGTLVKAGTGTMAIAGPDSLSGAVNVNGGTLSLPNTNALGSAPALTINSGGLVLLGNSTSLGANPTLIVNAGGTLRLNSQSITLPTLTGGGTVENASTTPVTLNINNPSDSTFDGILQNGTGGGALSLVKSGTGAFALTNANSTYTGITSVFSGVLSVGTLANGGSNSSIGASANGASNLLIQSGSTFLYTGATANTDRSFTVGAGGGTFVINSATAVLTDSGVIAGGSNAFIKDGPGKLTFTAVEALGSNSVTVNAGTLGFATQTFGRTHVLTIADGAVAESSGTLNLSVTGNGSSGFTDVTGAGTLKLVSTTNNDASPDIFFGLDHSGNSFYGTNIAANIDLGAAQRFIYGNTGHNSVSNYLSAAVDARIDGAISGAGGITFIAQQSYGTPGSSGYMEANLYLAGANTFSGPLEIRRGSVYLGNAQALNGNQVLFNSSTGNNAALFLFGNSVSISNLVSMGTGGALIANGNVHNGANSAPANPVTLTVNETADTIFNGVFVDAQPEYDSTSGPASGALSIVKTGSGTLTLAPAPSFIGVTTVNTSTYTGGTTVSGGTLLVNNATGSGTGTGNVEVGATAALAGTGTIAPAPGNAVAVDANGTLKGTLTVSGPVNVSGTVSPGSSPGIITTGDLTFSNTGNFNVELNGSTAGVGYDQIKATGAITLGGATLIRSLGFAPAPGTSFTIIDNEGASSIPDTFAGLPEGESFNIGTTPFTISYVGGDGNDVVLTSGGTAAPVVTGFTVNGGATQRSRLTTITVNFANAVDAAQFQSPGAVTLTRTAATSTGTVGTVVNISDGLVVTPASGNVLSITLTFANVVNAGVEHGSLADGRWQLAVTPASFTSVAGDPTLRRLFGDSNNDGTVDGADFASFGNAFGLTVANSPFDSNGDGTVDGTDFAVFGNRFGVTL